MNIKGNIRLSIESRLQNVRLMGAAVNGACLAAGCDVETAAMVELGVVEALNNVIKHAYQNQPEHLVEIEIKAEPDRMVFVIMDSGVGLSGWDKPKLEFDPNDPSSFPEGGMGRYIINKVMDKVEYSPGNNNNKINTLSLTKKL